MSGGVDSSVALMLLKQQGFEPIGVSLRFAHWQSKSNALQENVCCTKESFKVAAQVCKKLGVKYFILDARKEFKKQVMDYFLKLLKQGKTPNPCLICNKFVKLKTLLSFAQKIKADYVATGHYAKVKKVGDKFQLLRAKDKIKDQTYFLALLGQKELAKLIFPLADYTKSQVYKLARQYGFTAWEAKKQSQDLCFVANKSLPLYLEKKLGSRPGNIVDTQGNVLGRHKGLHFYTLGQRKGLKLAGGPFWVVGFDKLKNNLIVSNDPNDKRLFKKEVLISNVNYISGEKPKREIKVEAKTRFRQNLAKAVLKPQKDMKAKVVFTSPQKTPTPGQWLVFYQGNLCLGGGMIEN